MGSYVPDSSGSGWGTVDITFEKGNKLSGFIKCWEVLE
jgi:hypothetical protein